MGCLLFILAVALPRVALVVIFFATTWLQRAYETLLWPLLGFFFLPYTTLAYMWAELNSLGDIGPGGVALIILALVADLAHWGGGYRQRYSWRRVR